MRRHLYRFRGNDNRMGLAGLFMWSVVMLWVFGHYYRRHSPDQPIEAWPWLELSISEVLILGLAAVLALRSLVDSIALDRRGAGWGGVIRATATVEDSHLARRKSLRPFWSAGTALFWFEWKQNGWLAPCIVTGATSMVSILNVALMIWIPSYRRMSSSGHETEMMALFAVFVPLSVTAPWLSSIFTTHGKRALSQQSWPTSQSTLPISDCVLGWIIFASCLVSSLVSLMSVLIVGAFWVGAVELVQWSYGQVSAMPPMGWGGRIRQEVVAYVASIALTAWLAGGLSMATALSGRRWIAAIPLGIIPVWLVVFFVSATIRGNEFEMFAMCFTLGALFVGMIIAYCFCTMCGVTGGRSLLLGGVVLIVSQGILFAICSRHIDGEYFLLVTLWALAAAPPAILPLATYYNRHR